MDYHNIKEEQEKLLNPEKEQTQAPHTMNYSMLAGDMTREISSYLNAKDFKQFRRSCTFFATQSYRDLVTRVHNQQTVVDIKTGMRTTLLLMKDGSVWMAGHQAYKKNIASFERVNGINDVCQIAAGKSHYVFLKKDGTVWALGKNGYGQLGIPECGKFPKPVLITNLDNVCQIASQSYHTLFLKKDGSVWACGLNKSGQLGLGDYHDRELPTLIPGLTNICQILTGYDHSVFVKTDGTILTCGSNHYGQLALSSTLDVITPTPITNFEDVLQVSAGCYTTLFLKKDGSVWAAGANNAGQIGQDHPDIYTTPVPIPHLQNICQMAAGCNCSMLLSSDGAVLKLGGERSVYGYSNFSPIPTTLKNCTDVANIHFAHRHAFLFQKDGSMLAFGENSHGQLGLGDFSYKSMPTALSLISPSKSLEKLQQYHEKMQANRTRI